MMTDQCLQDNLPTDDEVKSIAAMVYVLGIAEFCDGVMQDPKTATGVMYLRMVSIWEIAVNVLVFFMLQMKITVCTCFIMFVHSFAYCATVLSGFSYFVN